MERKLGFNDSSIHWDLINTEDKIVTAKLKNGKTITIYENGMFKY
jgi:aminopeptidase